MMKKLKRKNELLNIIFKKIILILVVLNIILWGLLLYVIPHKILPFLQPLLSKYYAHLVFLTIATALLLLSVTVTVYTTSKRSPLKNVQLRYQLLVFYERFLKSGVEVYYQLFDEKVRIEIFCNGLVDDENKLAKQLSQSLRMSLVDFKPQEANNPATYILGEKTPRIDGTEEFIND